MRNNSTHTNGKLNVLILDAHVVVADALGFVLREMGFCETTIVKDALEARLEIIASGGFDLLILDVDALGLGSIAAVEKLITENGNKRTIIMTNRKDELGQDIMPEAEAFAVCTKKQPVTHIVDAMRKLLAITPRPEIELYAGAVSGKTDRYDMPRIRLCR